MKLRFFATCARGLESILAEELQSISAHEIEAGRGGVHFQGNRETLYRANLELRTAIRVLQPILHAHVESPDELYEAARTFDWSSLLTLNHTFAVDCNVRDSRITHSLYAALRIKDALCDQFVEKCGARPSVDLETPMLKLNLHIYRDEAILSLDSSGDSLHKRGYRPILNKAPLNEALAAALILHSKWNPATPLLDPMCGSGSIPIEAAWMALNRPPGLTRKRFGFQGWIDFDVELFTEIRDQLRKQVLKQLPAAIRGSDIRHDAIEFSRTNAKAAGIGHLLEFEKLDLRVLKLPEGPPGTLICNPPYGERLGEEEEVQQLYREMGETFRKRCAGWRCWVFTGNTKLVREFGLKILEKIPLMNGTISCQFVRLDCG
jgi:putative N6-adenine-specific DNA methylase